MFIFLIVFFLVIFPHIFLIVFFAFHLAFLHLFFLVNFSSCSCLLAFSIWSKKGFWSVCVCVFATLVWRKIIMQHGGKCGTTRSLVTKTE
jgi:hypothetical protein